VAVTTVGPGDTVVGTQHRSHTDCHRLLAGVEVRRTVDLAALEQRLNRVLEATDELHPLIQLQTL
jgi:hypothetical protein